MAQSRAGAGKILDAPGASCSTNSKDVLKKGWGMIKAHRSQSERGPNGQSRNNLSNKINNIALDYESIWIFKKMTE